MALQHRTRTPKAAQARGIARRPDVALDRVVLEARLPCVDHRARLLVERRHLLLQLRPPFTGRRVGVQPVCPELQSL